MKVSGKLLGILAGVIFLAYIITLKFATPSALVEVKEQPTQKWLVLGKSMEGGLLKPEFEKFFQSMNELKKQMGDSLPELTRYYIEPTQENKKFSKVFSGVIIPDSSYTKEGFVIKEITLRPSIGVQHMVSAGLYTAIDDYCETNKVKMDKNHVVEILAKKYTAIYIQKK